MRYWNAIRRKKKIETEGKNKEIDIFVKIVNAIIPWNCNESNQASIYVAPKIEGEIEAEQNQEEDEEESQIIFIECGKGVYMNMTMLFRRETGMVPIY